MTPRRSSPTLPIVRTMCVPLFPTPLLHSASALSILWMAFHLQRRRRSTDPRICLLRRPLKVSSTMTVLLRIPLLQFRLEKSIASASLLRREIHPEPLLPVTSLQSSPLLMAPVLTSTSQMLQTTTRKTTMKDLWMLP